MTLNFESEAKTL